MLFTFETYPLSLVWPLSSPALQLVHNGFGRDDDNGEHRVEVHRRRHAAAVAVWFLVCYYLHVSAIFDSPFTAGQESRICLTLPQIVLNTRVPNYGASRDIFLHTTLKVISTAEERKSSAW